MSRTARYHAIRRGGVLPRPRERQSPAPTHATWNRPHWADRIVRPYKPFRRGRCLTSARTGFFPHLRQGTRALPYKNLVGRHPCVPPTTALLVICHCETSAHAGCGNPHPPSPKASLPKGPWHGEAVLPPSPTPAFPLVLSVPFLFNLYISIENMNKVW